MGRSVCCRGAPFPTEREAQAALDRQRRANGRARIPENLYYLDRFCDDPTLSKLSIILPEAAAVE
jgi:hypothetical protein